MRRILVIDHQIDACNNLAGLLGELSYNVSSAYSGAAAIDQLASVSTDLVILNLEMHRLDGWQVLQAIRSNPALANVPVIVHSDLSGSLWQLARRLGADELWPRGAVSFSLMCDSLESHLNKSTASKRQVG